MTLMLASVTDAEEAETAVQHGAEIIDVKDVDGPFGTAAPALVRATVDAVAQRRCVSAVVGEPQIQPEALARAAATIVNAGASCVELSLYAHSAQEDCVRALSWLDAPREPDGVTFADQRPNDALIGLMAQSGFARAMVDTARKNGGRLLDHMDIAVIGSLSIVHAPTARSQGLRAAKGR